MHPTFFFLKLNIYKRRLPDFLAIFVILPLNEMERKAKKKNISKVLALEDLPLYQEDWLGLASLDNQQRLHKVPLETSDFI